MISDQSARPTFAYRVAATSGGQEASCNDQLLDMAGAFVDFGDSHVANLTNDMGAPAVLQDFSSMAPADQKKILLRRRKFDLQLRKIVEDGIRDGSIAPCDPKLAVFWFMGAVKSISQWYHADGTLTGEQVAREFIAFMSHGIRRGSSAQT